MEFRLGEIENLPVADNTIDVMISNCVINLSPDKKRVFQEAYRALKPNGRLMISDIVLLKSIPDSVRESIDAYVGCVAGALMKNDYLAAISSAGFESVNVIDESTFSVMAIPTDPFAKSLIDDFNLTVEQVRDISESIVSIKVEGRK